MVGTTILHYQLIEKLGAGGMGEIYKAQDTRLRRMVAIKILSPGMAGDTERRRRFFQEAQAASALNHPNIITLYDMVPDGDVQCIVMEYIDGKTLREVIPVTGLPVSQALQYAIQVASALGAAHGAGIVHRDLKPSNIMVTRAGLVKLLDFGLAKRVDGGFSGSPGEQSTVEAALTREGSIVGTVSYMSPEQAEGRLVDARSDIFSFGSVLYEMLTGKRAFEGRSGISTLSAILRDNVQPIEELAPDVPPQLEQAILRCLQKDPAARWQSMRELEAVLADIQRSVDPSGLYASPVRTRTVVPPSPPPVPDMAATVVWQAGRNVTPSTPSMPSAPVTPKPPAMPRGTGIPRVPTTPGALPSATGLPSATATPRPPAMPSTTGIPSAAAISSPPAMPSATGLPSATSMRGPTVPATPAVKVPPPAAAKPASGKFVGILIGLIGLVLLAAAGAGGWWWWNKQNKPASQAAVATPQPAAIQPQTSAPVAPPPEAPPPEPTPATPPPAAETPAKAPSARRARKAQPKAPAVVTPAPVAPTPAPVAPAPATPAPTPAPVVAPVPKPAPVTPAPAPVQSVAVSDALPFIIVLAQDVPEDAPEGQQVRFTAATGLQIGDKTVVAKGALVTGTVMGETGKKKFLGMGSGRKTNFELVQATAVDGTKLKVRAMAGRSAEGPSVRPFEVNKGPKAKGMAALQGTQYVGYIDGDQSVSVRK